MDQQPTKHRDVAGEIQLPSSSWVKLITLNRVLFPDSSKRTVVIELINAKHAQLLEDMSDLMGGDNRD
jgi:hypothetical protein